MEMAVITNPTAEQIEKAMETVNKSERGCMITGDRYALTKYGTFVDKGNISIPKSHIKAIRYINVYGNTCGYVSYALQDISMYSKKSIVNSGLTPVAENEIPNYFDDIETIIHQN